MGHHNANKPHRQHNNRRNLPEPRSEYLKDLEDWMDNRYNPGFYTGGRIPPFYKYPRKPLGYALLIFGIIDLAFAYMARIGGSDTGSVLFLFLFSLVTLFAGIAIITKKKSPTPKD